MQNNQAKPFIYLKKSVSQLKNIDVVNNPRNSSTLDQSQNLCKNGVKNQQKKFSALMNFSLDSDFDSIENGLDRISMIKELKNNRYKQGKKMSQSILSSQKQKAANNIDLQALTAFTNNHMTLRKNRVDAVHIKADLEEKTHIKKSVQF